MVRHRSMFVLGASMLALASLSAVAYRHHAVRVERQGTDVLARLSQCLLGGPLEGMVEPDRQLRAIQIAASLDPARHGDWPARCGSFASQLGRAAGTLRAERVAVVGGPSCTTDARCEAASALLEEVEHLTAFVSSARSGSLDLVRLRDAAAGLGLETARAADESAPAAPVALLQPAKMTPLYRGDYLRLLTDPPGDAEIELLFYEHQRRYGLCALGQRPDAQARCRILPSQVPVGFAGELLAGEPGAATLLYAQGPGPGGWTEGLFDAADGALLARLDHRPLGGFVWRDGSFARLASEADGQAVAVIRRDRAGVEQTERAELGASISAGPRLLWDEVVWATPTATGEHELFARRILAPGTPLGPAVAIGRTGPMNAQPSLDFCRTAEALVLLVGDVRATHDGRAALVFRTAAGWSAPHRLRVASEQTGFTCEGARATLSWIGGTDDWLPAAEAPTLRDDEPRPVRGRYWVHRIRCTAEGCDHARGELVLRRHSHLSRYVAGDLGSTMVVLWRSPLGDVRMRVGPLEDLAGAPEVPLFDDVDHEGFGWDLERHPIFGRGESVVVLLGTPTAESAEPALYGLRIDARGQASAVAVTP